MAILKKINFGDAAHDIAKTIVTAKSDGVMSVAAPNGVTNKDNEQANYQYELDVNVDGSTIVKSGNKLAVGTVPAEKVSVADKTGVFNAENVETALKELKDDIASTGSAAKTYKIVEVATEEAANTSLKEYKVQVAVGSGAFADDTASATIVVPKDQHLKEVKLVTEDNEHHTGQFLKYTYVLNTGAESDVYVDVSSFLTQSEFGDGLEVSSAGVVSVKLGQGLEFSGETGENVKQSIKVKIDSASESFLTIGADGVKLAGVQNAIDAKVDALDVTNDKAVEGQYVAAIQETNGIVSVKERKNVSEAVLNDYAKGSAPVAGSEAVAASDTINKAISKLEHQVDAAKAATTAAIEALDKTDTAEGGKVVTAVSTADGKAVPTKADFAGITLGGFTQDASATGEIASTDTLAAALNKLENAIDEASAEHSVVEKDSAAAHLIVIPSTAKNGKTTYTIGENNIASASDLTAEANRAKSAEKEIADKVGLTGDEGKRTFTPTTNYGGAGTESAATSVMDNMQKLDTQLKNVTDKLAAVQYKVTGTTLEFFGISLN